jgi:5-methylcytosine-specific restriction endonuclease McrA
VSRRRSVSRRMQAQIRRRANALCEYCHTAEQWQYVPFTVDHIVPLAQGGSNRLDNLALACFHCNRRKSAHTQALDPESNELVPLFHPRHHVWADHFIWSVDGARIVGLTPIGNATIVALELNRERALAIRAADLAVDRHPPAGDAWQRVEEPGG